MTALFSIKSSDVKFQSKRITDDNQKNKKVQTLTRHEFLQYCFFDFSLIVEPAILCSKWIELLRKFSLVRITCCTFSNTVVLELTMSMLEGICGTKKGFHGGWKLFTWTPGSRPSDPYLALPYLPRVTDPRAKLGPTGSSLWGLTTVRKIQSTVNIWHYQFSLRGWGKIFSFFLSFLLFFRSRNIMSSEREKERERSSFHL